MSTRYWQAKLQGLLRGLRQSQDLEGTTESAYALATASDRALFDHLSTLDPSESVTVRHLLSGAPLLSEALTIPSAASLQSSISTAISASPHPSIHSQPSPSELDQRQYCQDLKQQFWWLWRCLPEIVAQTNSGNLLTPASQILPDVSLWSQASITAALSGSQAGYEPDQESDRPYLVTFSFTPIQEVIKASRKMRDFWAGSWVLHYLSASICWKLACQYGPDCLIYPSLFQQPLIDHWLLQRWPEWNEQIQAPSARKLVTAGFPNVLLVLLPYRKVRAAMQTAQQILDRTWIKLGEQVFRELHDNRHWMRELTLDNRTWNGWLKHQWQPYWTALPLGSPRQDLLHTLDSDLSSLHPWMSEQNRICNLNGNSLFAPAEQDLLTALLSDQPLSVNVGSWWPHIFDQLRFSLSSVKGARVWKLPTAFGPRSTISGFGPVVYPYPEGKRKNLTESNTAEHWGSGQEGGFAGLFDGHEQLNATETLKRGLHKILKDVLGVDSQVERDVINAAFPDLTSGVAGYLKVYREKTGTNRDQHFQQTCDEIIETLTSGANETDRWELLRDTNSKWGIPFQDELSWNSLHNSRFLDPGWLVEDLNKDTLIRLSTDTSKSSTLSEEKKREILKQRQHTIQQVIDRRYPSNSPADWYVLAAGDGDGMRKWLNGDLLKLYGSYAEPDLPNLSPLLKAAFEEILKIRKRMGPSTHTALSRALLDFSNLLAPYLTEERYAGRLIYSGGDDILAYINLWEWDRWLWDLRQCFRGDKDPRPELSETFHRIGDYWQGSGFRNPELSRRPLFTMGEAATLSFGIVIAHHSVPLAIALENLWTAEAAAKHHTYLDEKEQPEHQIKKKDAVQVRVLFGNGNQLISTAKFKTFHIWQELLPDPGDPEPEISSALFEQAAQLWEQHPPPIPAAIDPWTQVFVSRRETFSDEGEAELFRSKLQAFLEQIWETTPPKDRILATQQWLKLAAFITRTRLITVGENP